MLSCFALCSRVEYGCCWVCKRSKVIIDTHTVTSILSHHTAEPCTELKAKNKREEGQRTMQIVFILCPKCIFVGILKPCKTGIHKYLHCSLSPRRLHYIICNWMHEARLHCTDRKHALPWFIYCSLNIESWRGGQGTRPKDRGCGGARIQFERDFYLLRPIFDNSQSVFVRMQ